MIYIYIQLGTYRYVLQSLKHLLSYKHYRGSKNIDGGGEKNEEAVENQLPRQSCCWQTCIYLHS